MIKCKAGTIREVHQQLVSDGYMVSEYALRKWIHDGVLPSVQSGKKFFITYDHVVKLLTSGSATLCMKTTLA